MKTWIGRKKIAFIPVFRPNAQPPDIIPADWANQILQRVLFNPDPTIQADRSLRAYIRAASSGLADLDVVVMPMASIEVPNADVRLEILDQQLDGPGLQAQGFDAAAASAAASSIAASSASGIGCSSPGWVSVVWVATGAGAALAGEVTGGVEATLAHPARKRLASRSGSNARTTD
jgi:hypothetical protein